MRHVRQLSENSRASQKTALSRNEKLSKEARACHGMIATGGMTSSVALWSMWLSNTASYLSMLRALGSIRGVDPDKTPWPLQGVRQTPVDFLVQSELHRAPVSPQSPYYGTGGTGMLSPEFALNAKRAEALGAGLARGGGRGLSDAQPDLHPHALALDPASYFDPETGDFRLHPQLLRQGRLWLWASANERTVFDTPLPRPMLAGSQPGPTLLRMYVSVFGRTECPADVAAVNALRRARGDEPVDTAALDAAGLEALLADERQRWTRLTTNSFVDTIVRRNDDATVTLFDVADTLAAHDSLHLSAEEQRAMDKQRNRGLFRLLPTSGHDDTFMVTPHERIEEIKAINCDVHTRVVVPWIEARRAELRTAWHEAADEEAVRELEREVQRTHARAMRELAHMGLRAMELAYRVPREREYIPRGSLAAHDALRAELEREPHRTANLSFAHNLQLTDQHRSPLASWLDWYQQRCENDLMIEGRAWSLTLDLLMCAFETVGKRSLMRLLMGEFGVGKSEIVKRIGTRLFPPGWFVSSGDESEKSGLQGGFDCTDRCVCTYDELPTAWSTAEANAKQEQVKEEIVEGTVSYRKVVDVVGTNGVKRHQTVTLITRRHTPRVIACNYGPCITRASRDNNSLPTASKQALISRTVPHFVRRVHGAQAGGADDVDALLKQPQASADLRAFRIFVCLVRLVKDFVTNVPHFAPDLSYGLNLFDEWNKGPTGICAGYGLPPPTARHAGLAQETLATLTIIDACARVFFYKQTAVMFEAGQLVEENGALHPRPFEMTMLWDVIRLLMPTEEACLRAWSLSLEYSLSTSSMGNAVMSILGELFGLEVGNLFRTPFDLGSVAHDVQMQRRDGESTFDWHRRVLQAVCEPTELHVHEGRRQFDEQDGGGIAEASPLPNAFGRTPRLGRLPPGVPTPCVADFESRLMLSRPGDGLSTAAVDQLRTQLARRRRAVHRYRSLCLSAETGGYAEDAILASFAQDRNTEHYLERVDVGPGDAKEGVLERSMSLGGSAIFPPLSIATLFYHPHTLVHWACRVPARVPTQCSPVMCVRSGIRFAEWNRPSTSSASREGKGEPAVAAPAVVDAADATPRYDTSWLELNERAAHECSSFQKTAEYIVRSSPQTQLMYGLYREVIADTLFLMTLPRNNRAIPYVPMNSACADVAIVSATDPTRAPGVDARHARQRELAVAAAPPRHPDMQIADTLLQRSVDAMINEWALPALRACVSPYISRGAPVRLYGDRLQAATAVMVDHVALVAEAALSLARVPGCTNTHEIFHNGARGPHGTDVEPLAADDPDAGSLARRLGRQLDDEMHWRMPFAYDMVQIHMATDMARNFFDSASPAISACMVSNLVGLGVPQEEADAALGVDTFPEISIGFPGLQKDTLGLRSLTIPVQCGSPPGHAQALHYLDDSGTPASEMANVTRDTVSGLIGRVATDEDVDEFRTKKAGRRHMHGVSSDLYNHDTWQQHAHMSLASRGLVVTGDPTTPWYDTAPLFHLLYARSGVAYRFIETLASHGLDPYGLRLSEWRIDTACVRPRTHRAELLRALRRAQEEEQRGRAGASEDRAVGKRKAAPPIDMYARLTTHLRDARSGGLLPKRARAE